MNSNKVLIAALSFFALILSNCGQTPTQATPIPPQPTIGQNSPSTQTPVPTRMPEPVSVPTLIIGGEPFKFLGTFVAPYYFDEHWAEAVDEDMISSAKANGVTVFYLMLPIIEPHQFGVFDEQMLRKIDHFLVTAAKHNTYVQISLIHPYGLTLEGHEDDPYRIGNPNVIDGLVNDPKLVEAFKNRVKVLIERQNSISGVVYRDDPTIMNWIICEEPIGPDWNYPPGQAPKVTIPQFRDWLDSMAKWIKSLDPNHLVATEVTGGVENIPGGGGGEWIKTFELSSIDFMIAEDADMRSVHKAWPVSDWNFTGKLLSLNKPLVLMADFTADAWDHTFVCGNYPWQAQTISSAFPIYYDTGISGIHLFSWTTEAYALRTDLPKGDECYHYTRSNQPIIDSLQSIVRSYDLMKLSNSPRQFVKIEMKNQPARANAAGAENTDAITWRSLGLEQLSITAVTINHTSKKIIYAAQEGQSNSGVWTSSDEGANWSPSDRSLPIPAVTSILVDPSQPLNVYAGTNRDVYKSIDGGESWSGLRMDASPDRRITALIVDPKQPATLYAGTYRGVAKSTDGGTTWKPITQGLTANWVFALAMDPSNSSILYAGTFQGVYKSTDGGESWKPFNNGLMKWIYTLVIDPITPTTIYAGTESGIYKSVDGGENWNLASVGLSNLDVQSLVMDPSQPARLYAGTYNGTFISEDKAATWHPYGTGLEGLKVFSLTIDPKDPTILYAGTSSGVFINK